MAGSRRGKGNTRGRRDTRGRISLSSIFNRKKKTDTTPKTTQPKSTPSSQSTGTQTRTTSTVRGNSSVTKGSRDRNVHSQTTTRNRQTPEKVQKKKQSTADRITQLMQGSVQQSVGSYRKVVSGTVSNAMGDKKNTTGKGGIAARRGTRGVSRRGSNDRNRISDKSLSTEKQKQNIKDINKVRESQKKGAERSSELASKQIERGSKNIEKGKKDLGKGGKYAADLLVGGTQLATDMAIGALTGGSSLPATFARAYGGSLDSAEKEGASDKQAMMYGLASAGLETATEKLGNIAAPLKKAYGKGLADDFVEKVVNKMSKQGSKNLAYHGGKTLMAAISEGLEEMIAEGLDPAIANAIYAESIGKPHSTTAKEVLYAGAVGAGLGGILGGGGQIVEYGRGKKISDTATERFGEGGIDSLIDKGLDIDEEAGGSTKAETYKEMVTTGGGIAYGQVNEMAKAVQEQEVRDKNRFLDADNAANREIKERNLDGIYEVDENGEVGLTANTQAAFNESLKSNIETIETLQLPELNARQVAEQVAAIQTGIATVEDISQFTLRNPENRAILETIMGVKLPETNQETKTMLFEMVVENRIKAAENQTAWRRDTVRGMLLQDIAPDYGSAGQSVIINNVDTINSDNINDTEMYLMGFDNAYNSGRAGWSYDEFENEFKAVTGNVPEEVLHAAYEAGIEDRTRAFESAEQVQLKLGQKVEKTHSESKSKAHRGKLSVNLAPENKGKFGAQEQIFYKAIARALNIEIRVVDNIQGNGMYVDGVVTMNVNGDRDLGYIFFHEITHHMQDYAPQEYQKLKEFLRSAWVKKDPEGYRAALNAKKSQYAQSDVKLNNEAALDEIIADGTYEFLQDETFINELCTKERGVAQALLDAIKSLIEKIRAILVDGDRFTPKQNEALYSNLDILKEMERLWGDALAKVVDNRDAVGTVSKSATVETGITYESLVLKPDMKITTVDENVSHNKSDVKMAGKENARSKNNKRNTDNETYVYVKDVDADIMIPTKALLHGYRRNSDATTAVIYKIGDYLENAIKINELNPQDENAIGTYILLGYGEGNSGRYPAYFVVNQYDGDVAEVVGMEVLDKLYSANAKKIELAANAVGDHDNKSLLPSSSIISISDLLDIVNEMYSDILPQSVADHYGNERKGSKLGKSVKYSLPDTDSTGRELSEGQREYFKDSKMLDEDGSLKVMYHGSENAGHHTFNSDFSYDNLSVFFTDSNTVAKGYSGTHEKYAARTFKTAEDLRSFFAEIGEEDYEIREEDGKLVLYDPKYNVVEATSDNAGEIYEEYAKAAGLDGSANYEVYLNIKNPLVIEADFNHWDEIPIPEELKEGMQNFKEEDGDYATTKAFSGYAYENGYDGVIFNDIYDNGLYASSREKIEASTVAIVFDSNQIKSVDNLNPTKDKDIRYSLQDSEGRELSEGQQKYFADSVIRDEHGRLKPMYHGTADDFTIFDVMKQGGKNGAAEGYGIYLTDSEVVASPYSNAGRLMKGYVNITNPATSFEQTINESDLVKLIKTTCEAEAKAYVEDDEYASIEDALKDTWVSNYVYTYDMSMDEAYREVAAQIIDSESNDKDIIQEVMLANGVRDYASAYKFYDTLKDTLGIDGFITEWESSELPEGKAEVVLAFDSKQFKNIDNLNPTEDPDVRYSLPDGEQLELKFNMTPKGIELAREAVEYINGINVINKTDANYVKTTAKGFMSKLIDDGTASIIGHQISSAEDLAYAAQVFRDPRYETTRYFFMDDENKVVFQTGVTSRLPGAAMIFEGEPDEYFRRLNDAAKKAGATKVWVLHNHPSGDPTPSQADIDATIHLMRRFGFVGISYQGHVVINSNKYAEINIDTVAMTAGASLHGLDLGEDKLLTPEIPSRELGEYITSADKLAQIAKTMQSDKDISTLIYTTSKGAIRAIQEFNNAYEDLEGLLKENIVNFGSPAVFVVTRSGNVFNSTADLIKNGLVTDAVMMVGDFASSLRNINSDVYPERNILEEEHVGERTGGETKFSLPDSDDIYDYVNSNETEFVEVPPTRDYEKEFARVKDQSVGELKKQVEKLQAQTKLTHGKVLDPKSVTEEINMLIKSLLVYNDGTKKTDHQLIKTVQENAKSIYTDIKNGNIEDAAIRAWDVAIEVVENLELINDEAYQEYKELRNYLKQTKIELPEDFPGRKEFRAENFGRLVLVNEGGRSVDDVYGDLVASFPGMFDETLDNEEDMLQEIADVRGSLVPYDIVLSEEETNQLIKETAHDILDIAVHGKPWKSWADRQKEIYDERTKKLKARHKEALRDVKMAVEMAESRKQAQKKRIQHETKERKNAEAEKRRHIGRIEKDLKWLSDRLLKPTDDKHLPDGYQKAIAELLVMVDPQTARSKKLEEKYGISKKRANFLKLKEEYENIAMTEEEGMIYNEDITNWCKELAKTLDDADSIADATVEEMRVIRQLISAIAHNIREQNKAFDENLKAGIAELATETIHTAKTSRKTGQRGGLPGALGTLLNESMVTPRDFFEGIGGGLLKAFMSIRKGHDKHVDNMTEAREFFAGLFGKYANKKKPGSAIEDWRSDKTNEKFELESGTITMNIAQKMSLHCLLKRKQAASHIFGSGIVVAEVSNMSKLKEALGAKKKINYNTTRITMEEAYKITATLTKEQIEIADKLQEFLNGRCAEWGNETSLKMFGYKKFTEEDYFPIKSSDVYLKTDDKNGPVTVERIRNFGFTKGTVVNAKNPIVIDDVFSVVADHVNKMSMYNSFAAPITDFMRVYNFNLRDAEGNNIESTKSVLANTYGKKAGSYISRFIDDLQSNTQTRQEGFTRFINKTLANYKKATIAANVRVALQQPTALIRAFTLIDPKYFIMRKVKGEDSEYKDMLKHCPVARWKSWGFSQVDMARDIDDIMMNKEWTKLDLVTMQVYGVLDLFTWSKIWSAVKVETKAKHPDVEVGSEEFYALCNERASEIFDKTQVVDSVIHRSQVMRNTDTMSKILTSFMAEPTRTYNMVRSEYAQAMDMWANGDKSKASAKVAKASSVYLLNALATAAAAAVADALRGKDLDGDDEEEEWWELTLENFMSGANPLNLLPVFKEVSSIWNGWDTSNMALEGIEALVKAEKGLFDKMKGESDKTWGELFRKQAEAMGLVFGVPVKNILREIESFGKLVGIDALAAEEGAEEEKKLSDRTLIKDGSGFDNFLNALGINLTEKESLARNFDRNVRSLNKATKGMTEKERKEYLWKEITAGYTTDIKEGNYDSINNMRDLLKETGGDYKKFEESVISRTKTEMKKSIGVDSVMTEMYREQLKGFGMTDAVINQEVLMKSEAAKAFQIEACKDSYEGMVETIRTLYDAGLTETELDVLYYNRTKAIDAKDYRTGELTAPCNGQITSTFGYRNAPTAGASSYHQGLDIAVPANSDIAAADGGKVSSVGYDSARGYYVKIYHGNGRYTTYAHLNGYYVQKGQAVGKGETIALAGSTGISTGPHLHFEVIENGVNVDPLPYLQ